MGLILSNNVLAVENDVVSAVKESPRGALAEALYSSPKIKKTAIINLINHTHFTGGHIQAHIRNTATGGELIVRVFPEPCVKEILIARWFKHDSFNPAEYKLLNIVVNDGKSLVLAPVETISITDELFIAALPEKGHLWNRRQNRRYSCENIDIDAEIIQDNNRIEGTLKDFSSSGFCIILDTESSLNFDSFDKGSSFFVQLHKEEIVYSGFCSYLNENFQNHEKQLVLSPKEPGIINKKRKNRSLRLNLVPKPRVIFNHPVINKQIQYNITDISTSGFAVNVSKDETILAPGMILKDTTILIAGYYQLKCSAYIVYCARKGEDEVQYGFSVYDMDLKTYNQLFNVIINAHDPYINISGNIDLDSLWEFFFQSKFIYPQKYEIISEIRPQIKETYRKLYHGGEEIFSNITYQKNGKISGHCSLLRAYDRTWLIQHLAATSKGMGKTGISVLNYLIEYVDGHFRLPSSHMDYLLFCYRPENKVPNCLFGGLCKDTDNRKINSIDTFSYMMFEPSLSYELAGNLKLAEFSNEDLEILSQYYESRSGGVLLDAIGLKLNKSGDSSITSVYNEIGLRRINRVYCLKETDILKAVIIVDCADVGVNMSELLNCMKIIVIDKDLPWPHLSDAIGILSKNYERKRFPFLLFPPEYASSHGIQCDKQYCLFAYDLRYWDESIKYLLDKLN